MNYLCFPPVIGKNSHTLILGSFPSAYSRKVNFYYGNPTNRFWKIISVILGEDFTAYSDTVKAEKILKHRFALSDVYRSCDIEKGSLDSDIKNVILNDIPKLIEDTEIKRIFITSKKAYLDFCKAFGKTLEKRGVSVINLPSPSSANRSKFKTDESLLKEWQRLFSV